MSGSSDGTVEVRITGTLDSSLPAATATASAEIEKLTAATGAATTTNIRAAASMQMVGAAALDEAAAVKVATAAHTSNRAATESLVIAHEALSGRLTRIPGSLMILAQAATGASGGLLLMGGAVLATVGVVGYLEYKALEAKKALDGLTEGFALTGRSSEATVPWIQHELDLLSSLPGVSSEVAHSFMELVARHADWSLALSDEVGQLMPAFVAQYGKEAPAAAGKLMEALSDLSDSGFRKLDRELLNLNPTQYETIENLIRIGDTAKATALILAQLSAQSGIYIKSLGDEVYDKLQEIKKAKDALAGTASAVAAYNQRQVIKGLEDQLAAIRKIENEQGRDAANNRYKRESDDIADANSRLNERTAILTRIATLQRETADAKGRGDTGVANKGQQDIAAEQAKLAEMDKRTAEAGYRSFEDAENAKAEAFKAGSAKRIQIAQEELDKAKALFGEQSDEYSRALARMNEARRAAAEQASKVKITRPAYGVDPDMMAEVKSELDQLREMDQSDAETSIRLAHITLDEKKQLWAEEVAAGKLTKGQAVRNEIDAEQAILKSQLDAQDVYIATLQVGTGAYEKAINDRKIIAAQGEADIASTLRQGAVDETQAANASAKAWEDANREIISSENQLVSGIFQGRQKLGQLLVGLARDTAQKEISADLGSLTERALLSIEPGGSGQQTTEKGGLLMNALGLGPSKAAGAATQDAATQANTLALQQLNLTLGGHSVQLAGNSVATTANTTGTVGQTGATLTQTGATVASTGATAANAGATIANAASTDVNSASVDGNTIATIWNSIVTAAEEVGSFLGFAGGGYKPSGTYAIVGEHGPEILGPKTAGMVTPNNIFAKPISLRSMDGSSSFDGSRGSIMNSMSDNSISNNSQRGGDTHHHSWNVREAMNFDAMRSDPRVRRAFTKEINKAMRRSG